MVANHQQLLSSMSCLFKAHGPECCSCGHIQSSVQAFPLFFPSSLPVGFLSHDWLHIGRNIQCTNRQRAGGRKDRRQNTKATMQLVLRHMGFFPHWNLYCRYQYCNSCNKFLSTDQIKPSIWHCFFTGPSSPGPKQDSFQLKVTERVSH